MQKIGAIREIEAILLPKIQKLAAEIRTTLAHDITEIGTGLSALRLLRTIAHEETNQILHEAMLLVAANWLIHNHPTAKSLAWAWNPRQTGGASEPDLQGIRGSKVIISAEATTSIEPKGLIDQRMAETLFKLSKMADEKYYFVAGTKMKQRAETKIRRTRYKITVVEL